MKNVTKLGYLAMVGLILLLSACSQDIGEKDPCSYCGGGIFAHRTNHGGMLAHYTTDFQTRDGKKYHPWCVKLFDSEN